MTRDEEFRLSAQGAHSPKNACHMYHDWESRDPLSQTVSEVILTVTKSRPTGGPPLAATVDPDALDHLFGKTNTTNHPRDQVMFRHKGCLVIVHRDGHIIGYPE